MEDHKCITEAEVDEALLSQDQSKIDNVAARVGDCVFCKRLWKRLTASATEDQSLIEYETVRVQFGTNGLFFYTKLLKYQVPILYHSPRTVQPPFN